jgi:hypothetical protein
MAIRAALSEFGKAAIVYGFRAALAGLSPA